MSHASRAVRIRSQEIPSHARPLYYFDSNSGSDRPFRRHRNPCPGARLLILLLRSTMQLKVLLLMMVMVLLLEETRLTRLLLETNLSA